MKTIVSITPLKVQEDSRTFKIAASFTRFGYRSIVVEGAPSDLKRSELPFELVSIGTSKKIPGVASPSNNTPGTLYTLLRKIYDKLPEFLKNMYILLYIILYISLQNIRLFRHIPRASLYYLHSPQGYPAVFIKCKVHNVPLIYDAHDFYPEIELAQNKKYYERRLDHFWARVERVCSKHAVEVVTVSDGVARLHREFFKSAPLVIRNCQDYRLDKKPTSNLRQLLGLSAADFLLVSVGQVKPGMAVEELLSSMQKLPPNVHMAFVGKNANQWDSLIQPAELGNRVHLVPAVTPFEVVPFIESADAAIILYYAISPDYLNCLPNRFFQAIGACLPLLYPKLPEIARIAERYNIGIAIDPTNPDSIRAGILRLISSPEDTSTYRNNLLVARQELSWEQEESLLRDLLLRCLKESK